MAAIDKIYGSYEQWLQLKAFLTNNNPELLRFLYPKPPKTATNYPLSNFSRQADMWLLKNCPLDFVVSAIKEQHSMK